MSYGIMVDGRDLGAGFTYQLFASGTATLAAGTITLAGTVYGYCDNGFVGATQLYRAMLPTLPAQSGSDQPMIFIKPTDAYCGLYYDGTNYWLASRSPISVPYMMFISTRGTPPVTSGFGAVVLAEDGLTTLMDMSKNNLVIRHSSFQNKTGTTSPQYMPHNLGYVPYNLAPIAQMSLTFFGTHGRLGLFYLSDTVNTTLINGTLTQNPGTKINFDWLHINYNVVTDGA